MFSHSAPGIDPFPAASDDATGLGPSAVSAVLPGTPEARGSARVQVVLRLVHTDGRGVLAVLADVPAGTPWSQVRPLLPQPWPQHDLYVDEHRLGPDDTVGDPPLVHLAQLRPQARRRPDRPLLELAVAEGPDSGLTHPLDVRTTVGRDGVADIVVRDPGLSRVHLEVRAPQGRVEVVDLDSTNGTCVDEDAAPARQAVPVAAGARVCAGNTVLRVHTPASPRPARWADGRREIHRPPRMVEAPLPHELRVPRPPVLSDAKLPWLLLLFPLPIAIGLALLLRSPMFLAFGLFGPLMMAGHHLHERRSGRQSRKDAIADHARATRRFETRRGELLCAELSSRRRLAPDLATLDRFAHEGRCWRRRPGDPDHLLWRVGSGTVPALLTVRDGDDDVSRPTLASCPVTLDLNAHGVVGLSAPDQDVLERALCGLVGQLAVTHSPELLDLLIISERAGRRWDWVRWLPHLRRHLDQPPTVLDVDHDADVVAALLRPWTTTTAPAARTDVAAFAERHTVVLLDLPEAGRRTLLHDLLRHGREHGVSIVAACADRSALPSECTAHVHLAGPAAGLLRCAGASDQPFVPDLPAAGWAQRIAVSLGPMRDVTPDADGARLPERVMLTDLPEGRPDVGDMVRSWTHRPRCTTFVLGLTTDGPLLVDLVRDGPHVLLGGTTGSGKSELLQGMIASLARVNRPDELVFLLVDYKGGAAFEQCSGLPHTVGLVTDLDDFLTRRALRSLEAEVHRRERLFADAGAKDLPDYQERRAASGQLPVVPRLVLAVDEFRVLAEELPDFIEGIVRLAAVGRSLGIHLVLATQRPAGVITADIRANVSLRIALRVRDSADSVDIIDTGEAATIPTTTPGRALMRAGSGRPVLVQTPHVSGSSGVPAPPSVRPVDPRTAVPAAAAPIAGGKNGSDLMEVVRACGAAAERARIPRIPSPWLPPLPPVVTHADTTAHLAADASTTRILDLGAAVGTVATPSARLGLADLPAEQARRVVQWSLATGHLALIGGPRSGRTSTVRAVVLDLAARHSPDDLHVLAMDSSGALGSLAALPHCGAVVDATDAAAVKRLLTWACALVRTRQQELAESGCADLGELRRRERATAPAPATILVTLDGWENFQEQYELSDPGLVDLVTTLLRDGLACGISLLLTGGRGLLSGRVSTVVSHRICLRTADEMDAIMAGLRPAQIPAQMPPGRGLLLPSGTEVQLAVPVADTSGAAVRQHIEALATATPPARRNPPPRFVTLPDRIDLDEIRRRTDGRREIDRDGDRSDPDDSRADTDPILGLGGDDALPLRLRPDPGLGMAALIAGATGSGRSTGLLTVAHQLLDRGPVLWWSGSGLAPDGLAGPGLSALGSSIAAIGAHELDRAQAVAAAGYTTLVVDDIDMVDDPALFDLVAAQATRAAAGEGALLLSGTPDALFSNVRGPVHDLRRRGSGVLLRPRRGDGDLFGAIVPTGDKPLPGRGVLLQRGRPSSLQVAMPGQGNRRVRGAPGILSGGRADP